MKVEILAWLGGISIPLGALLSIGISNRLGSERGVFNHFMTAVGGGALLSAVALVLVPEGMENQSDIGGVLTFIGGAVIFIGIDYLLSKSNGPKAQIVAMLSDFIPEAIAMGAVFTKDIKQAYLLAGIMFLQNFPEGYNAFNEIAQPNKNRTTYLRTLLLFVAISFIGPLCSGIGAHWLSDADTVIGTIMTLSGGGITYLIFRDIAPASNFRKSFTVPFGAIIGFSIGLLGWSLIY